MALLALPPALPFFFIPWTAPLGILIVFKFLLPAFTITFVEFAFAHYFFSKYHLLNTEHAIREVSTKQDIGASSVAINDNRDEEA